MYEKYFKELSKMSVYVGEKPDIVQGGGGNTSVKMDNGLMAIKASGCKLKEMTPKKGFVVVNYSDIRDYFEKVDLSSGIDYELDSVDFVKKSIVDIAGIKRARPSVESPFHSFLKNYVIHTHSIYANILCCSKQGKDLAEKIFNKEDFLWIPYVNPGFSLSMEIRKALSNHKKKFNVFPKIIFMQNHGLIVTEDLPGNCMKLNDKVNNSIIRYLSLSESYPTPGIKEVSENKYKSTSTVIKKYFNKSVANYDYLDKNGLYPDQLVYINKSFAKKDNKIIVNDEDEVIYNTNKKEASGIEETLSAYLYIVNTIDNLNLDLSVMNEKQKNFIYGWEIEKYRLKQINEN